MFNTLSKENVQGRKHPPPEQLSYRKPKHVIQNERMAIKFQY